MVVAASLHNSIVVAVYIYGSSWVALMNIEGRVSRRKLYSMAPNHYIMWVYSLLQACLQLRHACLWLTCRPFSIS